MASDGESVERLRDYLRTLKPEARAMLLVELERGLLRGDAAASNDLVLHELRQCIRAAAQPVPRIGDAARLFFKPIEPFLCDGRADRKRVGRLPRVALEPIWQWLGRDVMPAEIKALGEDIDRALAAGDRAKAEQAARALHDRAMQRIRDALAAVERDEKAQRRVSVQVGTPHAADDLATILGVFGLRDMLADLARRVPNHIRSFDREHIDPLKTFLDAQMTARTADPPQKSNVVLFGLVLVMSRMTAPWQLIRIATRAADSDDTARIAETPYAVAVGIVMSELENAVDELAAEFKGGRSITSMLKDLHDAARTLRTEMDLDADSTWSRQLAAIRSDVSDLLKSEIETAPSRVRRLLRVRPVKEIASGSRLDSIDVDDAQARVEFVCACRHYAAELAISEVTLRAYSEMQQYLEAGTRALVDSLRQAGEADLPFRQSQVEAAVRFCRVVFGAEYAALLAKAAEVAAQTAALDRKAVRA